MIPDWAWVAIVSVLVVALVYSWTRGQPRSQPAAEGPKVSPPSSRSPPPRSPVPPPAKKRPAPELSELARAVQMANDAILAHANTDERLKGMGTTICAARFSPNKQRLFVAHVGDSRLYRFRGGKLKQVTSDHTMADLGVTGPAAAHLSRAVGVWPSVPVDVILGKPEPGDVYMLCSDGLTKMLDDATIANTIAKG